MNCGEEKGQQCAGKVVGYDAAARVKFPITFVRNGLQWRTYLVYIRTTSCWPVTSTFLFLSSAFSRISHERITAVSLLQGGPVKSSDQTSGRIPARIAAHLLLYLHKSFYREKHIYFTWVENLLQLADYVYSLHYAGRNTSTSARMRLHYIHLDMFRGRRRRRGTGSCI